MLFAILLRADPERLHLRQSYVYEHLAYVVAQNGRIIAGGALRPKSEDAPEDALWLVHAETKEAAWAMAEGDPFFTLGLRQSIDIFRWSKDSWSEPFALCMSASRAPKPLPEHSGLRPQFEANGSEVGLHTYTQLNCYKSADHIANDFRPNSSRYEWRAL
jgi:uncharacterized protein YciI